MMQLILCARPSIGMRWPCAATPENLPYSSYTIGSAMFPLFLLRAVSAVRSTVPIDKVYPSRNDCAGMCQPHDRSTNRVFTLRVVSVPHHPSRVAIRIKACEFRGCGAVSHRLSPDRIPIGTSSSACYKQTQLQRFVKHLT